VKGSAFKALQYILIPDSAERHTLICVRILLLESALFFWGLCANATGICENDLSAEICALSAKD